MDIEGGNSDDWERYPINSVEHTARGTLYFCVLVEISARKELL